MSTEAAVPPAQPPGPAAHAAHFYDGKQARRHDVWVLLRDGVALIRSADGAVAADWPLSGVVGVQALPDGSTSFRLRARGEPARLVVTDPTLLQALRTGGVRRWPRRQGGWAAALAGCAAVIGLVVVLVDALPGLLAPLVPLSWEAQLGAGAQRLLLSQHRRCTGAEGQRALEGLTSRLAAGGGIRGEVQLTVADDPLVNAFTLPGNRMVVMRGLIQTAGSADELAGVIGHELGHMARRDPTRHVLRQLGFGAVAAAFGWGGVDVGGLAQTLVGLSYGRAAETAADAYAVAALRRAGLRADGLGGFFARMEAKESLPAGLSFLSDHPATTERRRLVEQPPDGAPALNEAEWQAVRTMCRTRD